jgi:hypothetical protein
MGYEIYQLKDENNQNIDVFAILTTISMRIVFVGNHDSTQEYIDELGLIGFSLDEPTQIYSINEYNQLCQRLYQAVNREYVL